MVGLQGQNYMAINSTNSESIPIYGLLNYLLLKTIQKFSSISWHSLPIFKISSLKKSQTLL